MKALDIIDELIKDDGLKKDQKEGGYIMRAEVWAIMFPEGYSDELK